MTERKLVGHDNFVRHNPRSDKFEIIRFHSVEFYCGDSINVSSRFLWGLGMKLVAKSDASTGNTQYSSRVLKSNDVVFVFTAPFNNDNDNSGAPHPGYSQPAAHKFIADHGLSVRAITMIVGDSTKAYEACLANGGVGVLAPVTLTDKKSGKSCVMSEVKAMDDYVFRWISGEFDGSFLPNYEEVDSPDISYGLTRIDHCVTNVPHLFNALDYLMGMTGFHEFGEFTADDVGTVDSGLNSLVLANNSETVLLPVNEPTFGTKKKSQIQTYLEHNNGAGVQHIALKTDDIFVTMRELKQRTYLGGFEFMPAPNEEYYNNVPNRIGENVLTEEQLVELKQLGLLADKDDQGVLLQVFTKPIGDRMTVFLEIIQRVGCDVDPVTGKKVSQAPGCGGFGKGNFSELFRSIERYESSLTTKA